MRTIILLFVVSSVSVCQIFHDHEMDHQSQPEVYQQNHHLKNIGQVI
jgi:hypothetical protein